MQVTRTVFFEVSDASLGCRHSGVDESTFLQVKKIATDKLREAFKDVQPQLEQPYRNNTGANEKPVRVQSEFDQLNASADGALPEK